MQIPGLSRDTIVRHADSGSVVRGEEYFSEGAVKALKRKGSGEVEAYVQGSDIAPYHVEIRHDENGITSAECTCPYVTGAWCRHIVATLLAVVNSEGVLSKPLDEMLASMRRDELVELIGSIIEMYPETAGFIEDEHRRRTSD